MTIIQIKKRKNPERIKTTCEYPDCSVNFYGTKTTKYCKKHRQKKYLKLLYAKQNSKIQIKEKKIKKNSMLSSNQIIKHTFKSGKLILAKCKAFGCHKEFDLLVIPKVYVYPKFCEEHRSEYRRNLFEKGAIE